MGERGLLLMKYREVVEAMEAVPARLQQWLGSNNSPESLLDNKLSYPIKTEWLYQKRTYGPPRKRNSGLKDFPNTTQDFIQLIVILRQFDNLGFLGIL